MIILLNEENTDLRGKKFPIFPGLKKHLKKVLKDYEDKKGDKTNPGYDHLVWLCDQESISTEEMKRIKNFFDNYKGTDKSDDFKLYGGAPMRDWVNRMLDNAKSVIKNQKQAMKDAGFDNAFRKSTDRDKQNTVTKAGVVKIQTKDFSNSLKNGKHIRESKSYIITEDQLRKLKKIINEAPREGFSLDKLESIYDSGLDGFDDSTDEAMDYLYQYFGEPFGEGSGRIVFDIDDDTVIKCAIGNEGFFQNEHEIKMTDELHKQGITIIPDIKKVSPTYHWIVAERVIPANEKDFEVATGYRWKAFGEYTGLSVREFIHFYDGFAEPRRPEMRETYEELANTNEWFGQLKRLLEITQSNDMYVSNFGLAMRNGKPTMVVLDLGV